MKYVSYARVSKHERATGSFSLPWQKEEIERWCLANGIKECQHFVDDGVSARINLSERPSGRLLIQAVKDGPATVICAHPDRVFRDMRDRENQIFEWAAKGVVFVEANCGSDLNTAIGRCTARILAAIAQFEREQVSERTVTRTLTRKRAGARYLRDAPYGYSFIGEEVTEDGRKTGGVLVKNEEEQRIISLMLQWRSRHWTFRGIADKLNEDKVPTRRGKPWSHTSIVAIINTARARLSKRKRDDGKGPVAPDLGLKVSGDHAEDDL